MTLKGYLAIFVFLGKLCIYVFKSAQYIVSSPRWIFISFPVGFLTSLVENLLLGLTPEIFENSTFSPVSRAVPTGVLRQGVLWLTMKRVSQFLLFDCSCAINWSSPKLVGLKPTKVEICRKFLVYQLKGKGLGKGYLGVRG